MGPIHSIIDTGKSSMEAKEMSFYVRSYNKKTGVTYVYESSSYWDKEAKMPRAHRRLIGKINPQTGEIVPTGKRGPKPKKQVVPDIEAAEDKPKLSDSEMQKELRLAQNRAKEKEARCESLEKEVRRMRFQNKQVSDKLVRLEAAVADLRDVFNSAAD